MHNVFLDISLELTERKFDDVVADYHSLLPDAPLVGPNVKSLKFDLENINDGMVIAIDVYAAYQVKN